MSTRSGSVSELVYFTETRGRQSILTSASFFFMMALTWSSNGSLQSIQTENIQQSTILCSSQIETHHWFQKCDVVQIALPLEDVIFFSIHLARRLLP